MRTVLVGLALLGGAAPALTACQAPPKPVVAAPEPAPPALAPPRPPAASFAPVASTWSFQTGDTCSATASNPVLSLEVSASDSQLQLVLHAARRFRLPAHATVPIAFAGPSGNWTVSGLVTPGRISAASPMTEYAAGRVLVLLDGGIIQVRKLPNEVPQLRVPSAGSPGRVWFECVRRRLFP
jgi:hypothetical protein